MASSLSIFTLVFISIQTLASLLWGWITLECQLEPNHYELQEVTLMKLLYLYDPEACGRLYFYNYTVKITSNELETSVKWPVKNFVAARFRKKVQLHVALHVFWFVFCIAYMTQGHRVCGFYAALLPFIATGVIISIVDIINAVLFLTDTRYTESESDILKYINRKNDSIFSIHKPEMKKLTSSRPRADGNQDTSWISLLFAYCSCRGVVFWVFNMWMIKDNYFQGLQIFRRFQTKTINEVCRQEASQV